MELPSPCPHLAVKLPLAQGGILDVRRDRMDLVEPLTSMARNVFRVILVPDRVLSHINLLLALSELMLVLHDYRNKLCGLEFELSFLLLLFFRLPVLRLLINLVPAGRVWFQSLFFASRDLVLEMTLGPFPTRRWGILKGRRREAIPTDGGDYAGDVLR